MDTVHAIDNRNETFLDMILLYMSIAAKNNFEI